MVAQIEQMPVRYPFSFAIAGDSGAWPDPTAEAIFTQLVRQVGRLQPRPVFFANLGDFAGPGTAERHEIYLRHVESLDLPNICVLGNHDLDDAMGVRAFADIHGPTTFDFAYGNTRFFVMRSVPGQVGAVELPSEGPDAGRGPDEEDLALLAGANK